MIGGFARPGKRTISMRFTYCRYKHQGARTGKQWVPSGHGGHGAGIGVGMRMEMGMSRQWVSWPSQRELATIMVTILEDLPCSTSSFTT